MTTLAPALWRAGERAFPPTLARVPTPPRHLYTLGDRGTLDRPCVAIVGTRYPSEYGVRVTRQLSATLANAGICVISGLAQGIDAVAHQSALANQGATVAVLGGGIDKIYPTRNRALYHRIAHEGMIVSEFEPGHPHFPGCFPRRNRLIAGLASVTIVVEAGIKSGALITANYAVDMGRMVAAIPGPIDAPSSAGTNQLLRDGAHVIASVDDALTLVDLATPHETPEPDPPSPETLDANQQRLLSALANETLSPDALAVRSNLAPHHMLATLTSLELLGMVQTLPTGEIRRR